MFTNMTTCTCMFTWPNANTTKKKVMLLAIVHSNPPRSDYFRCHNDQNFGTGGLTQGRFANLTAKSKESGFLPLIVLMLQHSVHIDQV